MTRQEIDAVQRQLNQAISTLEGEDALLMALHFAFGVAHTMALDAELALPELRRMLAGAFDKYLVSNPYGVVRRN